ncbi:MAG: putative phosphoribosyl transferase [Firmicutes bacterium ADurb.Bin506]|jgi:putative phosphoribosyl transferase|nr:MAG: putative phosphoribosyl transferase [Firmicutes bacterium ADurb.Bin506]
MLYRDRREAGRLLGQLLAKRSWNNPVVLGLPRGGVPVAIEVAKSIDGDVDIVLSKKIGAPFNPELALGAVDMSGIAVIDSRVLHVYGVTENYIREQVQRAAAELRDRAELYRGNRAYPALEGRDVILVDDGIATGHTLISAARSLAGKGAAALIMAAPVCPPDVIHRLEANADLVIVLNQPRKFESVSQCYEHFRQLTDDQVRAELCEAWGIS